MGKLTPSSLFYLPCQAENPVHSFFIDHNSASRQPLDPYVWAGYAANHHRPEPEPSATVATTVTPTVAEPVQQPMPPTVCPKLRRMREMIAGRGGCEGSGRSGAASGRSYPEVALDPGRERACGILPAWGRSARRWPEHGRDRDVTFGRRLATPAIRPSVGARSRASCGRFGDRLADWPPDNSARFTDPDCSTGESHCGDNSFVAFAEPASVC